MEKGIKLSLCKLLLLAGLIILAAGSAGCGRDGDGGSGSGSGETDAESEYVYVPEFYCTDEAVDVVDVNVGGDYIYYSTSEGEIFRFQPGQEAERLALQEFEEKAKVSHFQPDPDGNLYVLYETFKTEAGDDGVRKICLVRYDAGGKEVFRKDITGLVEGSSVKYTAVDGDGCLFIRKLGGVVVIDSDGEYKRDITDEGSESISWIAGDWAGKVYGCYQTSAMNARNGVVYELSHEAGLSGTGYREVISGNEFAVGDTGFITFFDGILYDYDRDTGASRQLMECVNYGIDVSQIQRLYTLRDGSLVFFLRERNGLSDAAGEIAVLLKKDSSQVVKKEVITLGTFSADGRLQRAVALFNRQSESYRVEVKEYYDYSLDSGAGGDGMAEARTALHLDIVSGNCPDILCLEYSELEMYASKGLFADLTPWLEKSGTFEFMPQVVEAYTFGGKLIGLPASLQVRVLLGKASDIGGEEGWTRFCVGELLQAAGIL